MGSIPGVKIPFSTWPWNGVRIKPYNEVENRCFTEKDFPMRKGWGRGFSFLILGISFASPGYSELDPKSVPLLDPTAMKLKPGEWDDTYEPPEMCPTVTFSRVEVTPPASYFSSKTPCVVGHPGEHAQHICIGHLPTLESLETLPARRSEEKFIKFRYLTTVGPAKSPIESLEINRDTLSFYDYRWTNWGTCFDIQLGRFDDKYGTFTSFHSSAKGLRNNKYKCGRARAGNAHHVLHINKRGWELQHNHIRLDSLWDREKLEVFLRMLVEECSVPLCVMNEALEKFSQDKITFSEGRPIQFNNLNRLPRETGDDMKLPAEAGELR